ncbi:ABC transporter substrate-binding protein [Corynebacterium pacaense]|uniref:ABC transporter substrate-binding protein n=1 Tax=Corynebacterium pacaense TaxID=1816684 RepID=UPI0015C452DF|nr:ABC transporter substrate-binding protein [Corynebacterium pacaense]
MIGTVGSLLAAALLVTGCSSESGADGPGASEGEISRGGELRVGLNVDPGTLDPAQTTFTVTRQLYDSLTALDLETGEIRPWIAESWEVNGDSTEFTFKIRDDVTFSNGTKLNAETVKVNFDEIVRNSLQSFFPGYLETEVVDEYTAKVTFSSPNSGFLQATSVPQLGLREPSTIEGKTKEERSSADSFIGSGPFVLDSYDKDQEIVLKQREGYTWGSPTSSHQDEAYIDSLKFLIVPENGVRTGLLQSDQLDIDASVNPADESTNEAAGFTVHSRILPGLVQSLYPHISSPRLADESVRQALQISVDREDIVNTLLTPNYRAATNAVSQTTPGWTDLSEKLEYDPEEAKSILDGAGWREGPDGIREKDGVRLSFEVHYLPNTSYSTDVLELVQQQLREVGFELSIKQSVTADFLAALRNPEVDFTAGNQTRADIDVLRTAYSPTSGSNFAFLDAGDPIVELIEQIPATSDPEKRNALGEEAATALLDHGIQIPLFDISQSVAVSPKVQGLGFESSSRPDYYSVWLEN